MIAPRLPSVALAALALLGACGRDDAPATDAGPFPPDAFVPDREPGARAPRTAACDPADPARCLLPWPSNTFTTNDPASATGLRVRVEPGRVAAGDDAAGLDRADGFSRVSPVVTAFPLDVDPASLGDGTTGAVRVLVAQPGARFGEAEPVRLHLVPPASGSSPESVVVALPRRPLAPATDHVVAVLDALRARDGRAVTPDDHCRVALGLRAPATLDELALRAYHAPSRAALARAGIDPARVVRVWDFTTRSREQPARALRAMRDAALRALAEGRATVAVDTVTAPADGPIAAVVRGRLVGLPRFVTDAHRVARDATGSPVPVVPAGGAHAAPFRVMIPRGTGDYPVVVFGHGTGGDVSDPAFDASLAGVGAGKLGFTFDGWTSDGIATTLVGMRRMLVGVEQASAGLLQSLAEASALFHALAGDEMGRGAPLADALSAPTLGGRPNPAAGRRPDLRRAAWAGGSLGGTMGLVFASVEPRIAGAVLNVPGAGWSHFVPLASLFELARIPLRAAYPTGADLWIAVSQSQANWDEVDGAAFADLGGSRPYLLQQSMGDPILPNVGTELAAAALGATQVGAVLSPVWGAARADEATGRSALTQFRVPGAMPSQLEVHGFGDRATPAGVAAREQIEGFLRSVWAGAPVVTVPPTCRANTPPGSCDFSSR